MDDATQKHRDSDWSALAAVDLSLVSPDTRDDDWYALVLSAKKTNLPNHPKT
jgi:hypothetical protein